MDDSRKGKDHVQEHKLFQEWFFWDENWDIKYGPYVSEAEARTAFKTYCAKYRIDLA